MKIALDRQEIGKGIAFSVISDPKFKHNRISVNLAVPLARDTATGYAIVPFLMRKGCASCPDFTKLNEKLDELYGASLSSDVSKVGANQIINLSLTSIDDRFTLGGERMVEECAKLLCDLATKPNLSADGSFLEEEVAVEKQNLIDTIEAEINDKRSYAIARCRVLMDENDPSAVKKYGYAGEAKKLTGKEAGERYRALLKTAQAEVVFLGSGNPEPAREIFRKAFEKLDREPAGFTKASVKEAAKEAREFSDRMDVIQSKLVLAFRSGPRKESLRERAATRLMTALYGGTPSSKLFLNVREKLSLCYYCAARFDYPTGIMMVDSGVESRNVARAKEEILRQLGEIQSGRFTGQEVEETRLQLKNSLRTVGDSLGALESWYLSQIAAGRSISPYEEIEALDAVTREEIVEAAKKISLDTVYLLTAKEGK